MVGALTRSDLRVRYGRGRLRTIKWLLDPFAAVGVYLLLVAFVLNRRGYAVGLSIACAVVPFQLVMMTIINALRAVDLRRSVITNMAFDKSLIPVASVCTEAVGFSACFVLLGLLMAVYGVAPTPWILMLPADRPRDRVLLDGLRVPGRGDRPLAARAVSVRDERGARDLLRRARLVRCRTSRARPTTC